MKITAVRHGETNENAAQVIQGQSFGTLSSKGLEQIQELGLKLESETFDAVYGSDLERCVLTANAILQYHPEHKIIYDKRLRERSLKPVEGMTFAELNWTPEQTYGLDVKTSEGESWNDVYNRVLSFIEQLRQQPEQNVLLVTHGGPLRILESILGNLPLEESIKHFHDNCAILTWEV